MKCAAKIGLERVHGLDATVIIVDGGLRGQQNYS